MNYKKLIVRGISYSQTQSGAYALLLEHEASSIKIPIVIGNFEAQSITLGLEKDLKAPRPLTHDLFAKFILMAHYKIISVVIHKITDGVFFSNINLLNTITNEEMTLDARTSDAVAMAIRFNSPIYATDQVMNEAGILLEIEDPETNEPEYENLSPDDENPLMHLPISDLNILLEEAVSKEDFDTALELQEEIKRRNNNKD
ncbi:MAG: bifunctional nuclease family protein [Bergeyella zoohelcum]|nr:bifunctional nuclease family protein [Bergeyella zoohelcum]